MIDASRSADPDPDVVRLVGGSLGRLLAGLGAEPLPPETWWGLPGLDALAVLHRIRQSLADPSLDAVVVDCGDLSRARDLISLPGVLLRLLDAAMTPRLAMWRPADGPSGSAETAFDALSRARDEVARMQSAILHPATTMRLVTVAQEEAVSRTLRAVTVFGVLGVGVDGLVAHRYPRKSDGWPRAAMDEHARQLERLRAGSDGIAVWKSPDSPRAVPKGRSAMGPLGRVHVLDAEQITVRASDEEFMLDLPLSGSAAGDVRVGLCAEQIVLAVDGVHRWLDLPSVLRRCRPTQAVRTTAGLRVEFVPDPLSWRRPDDRAAS